MAFSSSKLLTTAMRSSFLRFYRLASSPILQPTPGRLPGPFLSTRFCSAAAATTPSPAALDVAYSAVAAVSAGHPWPEWGDFLEKLRVKGYFVRPPLASGADAAESAAGSAEAAAAEETVAAADPYPFRDQNRVKNACLKFARERFDLLRFAYKSWNVARRTGLEGAKKWGNPDGHRRFPCANRFFSTFHCQHSAINEGTDRVHTRRTTEGVILSDPTDDVTPKYIIENTTHRDGSIYKGNFGFLKSYRITDRNETRLEPKMYSEPTDCQPDRERCIVHSPSRMMQIYSLKLSQIPIDHKSVELYGYIAVRDYHDSMLNYIVNLSRDDPIIVQQGSLIHMTGPKRGISMSSTVLLEFDMRIKKGEQEENDLQLIDGASEFCEVTAPLHVYTMRINGDCGAVDITLALVYEAVEATIEVVIPEVLSGFSLSLSS